MSLRLGSVLCGAPRMLKNSSPLMTTHLRTICSPKQYDKAKLGAVETQKTKKKLEDWVEKYETIALLAKAILESLEGKYPTYFSPTQYNGENMIKVRKAWMKRGWNVEASPDINLDNGKVNYCIVYPGTNTIKLGYNTSEKESI